MMAASSPAWISAIGFEAEDGIRRR